ARHTAPTTRGRRRSGSCAAPAPPAAPARSRFLPRSGLCSSYCYSVHYFSVISRATFTLAAADSGYVTGQVNAPGLNTARRFAFRKQEVVAWMRGRNRRYGGHKEREVHHI